MQQKSEIIFRTLLSIICFNNLRRGREGNVVRFYRARQWNGFYCVDDFIRDGEHDAITCSGVRKVGKVSRIHITDETIRTELFEVHWSEVPASWQESFRGYLWRSRSRL